MVRAAGASGFRRFIVHISPPSRQIFTRIRPSRSHARRIHKTVDEAAARFFRSKTAPLREHLARAGGAWRPYRAACGSSSTFTQSLPRAPSSERAHLTMCSHLKLSFGAMSSGGVACVPLRVRSSRGGAAKILSRNMTLAHPMATVADAKPVRAEHSGVSAVNEQPLRSAFWKATSNGQ